MSELKEFDLDEFELDEEEQEILDAFERGELQPIPNMEEEIQNLKQAARLFLESKREYSVVITREELETVKQILSTQLEHTQLEHQDLSDEIYRSVVVARHIKSLLDKIDAAIESQCSLQTSS